jgi:hypothetical protein
MYDYKASCQSVNRNGTLSTADLTETIIPYNGNKKSIIKPKK